MKFPHDVGEGMPEDEEKKNLNNFINFSTEKLKNLNLEQFPNSQNLNKNINLVINLLANTGLFKKQENVEFGELLVLALCLADSLKDSKNEIEKIEKDFENIKNDRYRNFYQNKMRNNAFSLGQLLLHVEEKEKQNVQLKKSFEETLVKKQIRKTLSLLHTDVYNILLNLNNVGEIREEKENKEQIEKDIKEIKNKLEEGFNGKRFFNYISFFKVASKIGNLLKEMLTIFPNIFLPQRSTSLPTKLNGKKPKKHYDDSGIY